MPAVCYEDHPLNIQLDESVFCARKSWQPSGAEMAEVQTPSDHTARGKQHLLISWHCILLLVTAPRSSNTINDHQNISFIMYKSLPLAVKLQSKVIVTLNGKFETWMSPKGCGNQVQNQLWESELSLKMPEGCGNQVQISCESLNCQSRRCWF